MCDEPNFFSPGSSFLLLLLLLLLFFFFSSFLERGDGERETR